MHAQAIKTQVFKKDENLSLFVFEHLKKIPERSVLVIASKIVALSEGRTAKISEKNKLIKKESSWTLKVGKVWLTEKSGMIMANAGIDESNAQGELVLLPKDSFASAERLRKILQKKYRVKNLGIIIADSALMPLRAGVVGAALGYAGFKGVRDYRGKKDIFGRQMRMSRTNVADSLATAGTLVMGEGSEQQPLTLITEAPVEFVEKINKKELKIAPKEDIFWPLLKRLKS
ncbi:MAG: coenzyme F420-0:L-glutamate ligase [Candidatus Pacebacteria bacterium]|nr:coenzyme F420-0:L-glutamate ligase [Candidatus Paceibacterota bacterium]MBP9832299.1 coenzyme F420-0:L-glutamate ligase [Candidatus Paceibacterota bacterium]